MLRLTRKKGERIRIGNDITIEVVFITGNRVALGIEAPSQTKIWRDEIYDHLRHATQEPPQDPSPNEPTHETDTHPNQ